MIVEDYKITDRERQLLAKMAKEKPRGDPAAGGKRKNELYCPQCEGELNDDGECVFCIRLEGEVRGSDGGDA